MVTDHVEPETVKEDKLHQGLEHLTQVLAAGCAGREGAWAQEADAVLAELEAALRQHGQAAEAPNGFLSKVDLTRPSLVRRVNDARQQHRTLQADLAGLRQDLRRAGEAFGRSAQPGQGAHDLPPLQGPEGVPDFGVARRRAEEIAAALRKLEEEEADLLLESVNMDLGAGD
jgi:hypothetical protein